MILVAGSTGLVGNEIVRRLRARGESVRALVRTTSEPGKVEPLRQVGAEIARGDVKDRKSLDAACKGVRSVISTVASIATAQSGDSFADTDARGNINLIDAARAAGVRHFVFVSFNTADALDAPLSAAKKAVEEHLSSSGMAYTILQPSLFMEIWLSPMLFGDPATATARVYGPGDKQVRYVSAFDVAEATVRSLSMPEARNATIRFGGPEAVTQRDVVRIFEQAFGKPFTVTDVPTEALEAQWRGAEDPLQKTFAALTLGFARGFDSDVPDGSAAFGMEMTGVSEYVKRLAANPATATPPAH